MADADHDGDVDQGDEGGHRAEEERLVDDDVDVVKVVFEDRDPGGDGNPDQRPDEDDVKSGRDLADLLPRGDQHDDAGENHGAGVGEPLQLMPLNRSRTTETADGSKCSDEDQAIRAHASQSGWNTKEIAERLEADGIRCRKPVADHAVRAHHVVEASR